jgi:hypothetical protein
MNPQKPQVSSLENNAQQMQIVLDVITKRVKDALDHMQKHNITINAPSVSDINTMADMVMIELAGLFGSSQFADRTFMQKAAYNLGQLYGYPEGVIDRVLSIIPLYKHFKAGRDCSAFRGYMHADACCVKVSSWTNTAAAKAKSMVGVKLSPVSANPTNGAIQSHVQGKLVAV